MNEPVKAWEFKQARRDKAYAERGYIKTYANRAQAYRKLETLKEMGLSVAVTASHPFLIIEI